MSIEGPPGLDIDTGFTIVATRAAGFLSIERGCDSAGCRAVSEIAGSLAPVLEPGASDKNEGFAVIASLQGRPYLWRFSTDGLRDAFEKVKEDMAPAPPAAKTKSEPKVEPKTEPTPGPSASAKPGAGKVAQGSAAATAATAATARTTTADPAPPATAPPASTAQNPTSPPAAADKHDSHRESTGDAGPLASQPAEKDLKLGPPPAPRASHVRAVRAARSHPRAHITTARTGGERFVPGQP